MGLAWGWDTVRETHGWGRISEAGSFLYWTPVNVNKALNEIPVLSRASMFTSQQVWAEEGSQETWH